MTNLARLGKIDVRRDENQNVKLNQIIKLLADAGYYRARVKGLSPFDKIVGGMTWSIEVCNFDIDVELLFHDNLSIGQKISLTEKIVKVLPHMKCPYRIEPHQIQGLDTIHIFPVIEWLVTQALETRAERQDETRIIALNEFERHFGFCLPKIDYNEIERRNIRLRDIKLKYGPKRRFRRAEDAAPKEHFSSSVLTLLEYSESQHTPQLTADSDSEEVGEEEEKIQVLLSQKMCQERDTSLSTQKYGILEDQIEDVAEALVSYLRLAKGKESSAEQLVTMEKKLKIMKEEINSHLRVLENSKSKEQHLMAKVNSVQENLNSLSKAIEIHRSNHSIQEDKTLNELSNLMEANEKAKKAIATFKENCLEATENIKERIRKLKEEYENSDDSIPESLVKSQERETARLKKAREIVATKTRETESLKRIIDDVPGRAELSQYQKRFVELYNMVDAEHHETLQFYNMYNALADSRSYMEKESEILNSILDNLNQALVSPSCLEDYVSQLKNIIEGIKENKVKLENKRNEARLERTAVVSDLNRLQELQLLYAKTLYQFSQEIAKNEYLHEILQ